MSFGIRVFRSEYGLSWMQARRAARLFREAPAKWPPELQKLIHQKSPSGTITAYPKDLAVVIAEFVRTHKLA